jgi:hypothetical protein
VALSPELASPLLTDDDVQERVTTLIGRATQDRCLWLMLVDGDRRQAPVVMPVEDSPVRPDPALAEGLRGVLEGLTDMLATDAGPGSCVFVWERLGPDGFREDDEVWARALAEAATGADLGTLGIFLSTPAGVRRLR